MTGSKRAKKPTGKRRQDRHGKRKKRGERLHKDKNVSKEYPNGRTLKTRDEYLPTGKGGKVTDPKATRRVVVIDSNRFGELAVVALTTQKTANTTALPSYTQGNGAKTYFKHFVEILDNEGLPIVDDEEKFKQNPWDYDLNKAQVQKIRNVVLVGCKQSQANVDNIKALKRSNGKLSKRKRQD